MTKQQQRSTWLKVYGRAAKQRAIEWLLALQLCKTCALNVELAFESAGCCV